jgi:C4-dicarboxylate transporter DctM subunit
MFKVIGTLLGLLAMLGMPLFAVMGGIAQLSWLSNDNPEYRFLRFLAPNVLEDRFAASPILVTIPLFTFAGYLMAESKTPDRLVRAASSALGWMPGGLAVVCIVANAFFTTMTGGSGVTIVAIGGLLFPALVKQGYPEKYALGLVTAAGAVGLLFFPSPLVMVYAFIAGVDIQRAYLATFVPGVSLMLVLCAHAVYVGVKAKIPRGKMDAKEIFASTWAVKWELAAPFLVGLGMGSGLMGLDEASACAALYVLIVEVYVYKDLSWKDVVRIAKEAMSLAGAIIIILAMATALTNYIVQERIPQDILEWFIKNGMDSTWQFILVLNLFLFVLGVVMDEFSALLVALPLVMPLAARFGISPYHLAVMFLLNIEIAYISPPIGINLYIASFRFNKPVDVIYRVVMPFCYLLTAGLVIFILFPKASTFTVDDDIVRLRAEAEKAGLTPRDAWMLECVQEDRNNPRPCRKEDIEKYGPDGTQLPNQPKPEDTKAPAPDNSAAPKDAAMDDLFKDMMGDSSSAASSGTGGSEMDKLLQDMLAEGTTSSAASSSSGGAEAADAGAPAPSSSASAGAADAGPPKKKKGKK